MRIKMNPIKTKRIAYISDVHVDHYDDPWTAIDQLCESVEFFDCDWLLIAGDLAGIGNVSEYLVYMAGRLGERGIKIFFTCGNHEFYGYHINDIHNFTRKSTPDNLFVMNRRSYIEDDILLIGAPGWIDGSWYNVYYNNARLYKDEYNDFRLIAGYTKNGLECGRADYRYIDKMLSERASKKIVMTHFLPSPECIEHKYIGDRINHCYANNWSDLFHKHNIDAWIYGHSHAKMTSFFEDTELKTNGIGYPSEPNCSIKIHVLEI